MDEIDHLLLLTAARLLRKLYAEKPIQYSEELAELDAVLTPFETYEGDNGSTIIDSAE